MGGSDLGLCSGLLNAAVVTVTIGIFKAQTHLWTIFLKVEELLAVERSTTLPENRIKQMHRITT